MEVNGVLGDGLNRQVSGTGGPRLEEILPSGRTAIMGVLNVTPDSFYDGGHYNRVEKAIARGIELAEAGADLIDVGGESTRPGAQPVAAEEELRRVIPVIRELSRRSKVPISVDTMKAVVAEAALDAGASVVNDVSAGSFDPAMLPLVAARACPIVLMHMRGTPADMQVAPTYGDVVGEVCTYLESRRVVAREAGIATDQVVLDPGIGFGKRLQHNLELLAHLDRIVALGSPVLVGVSRKSFIGELLNLPAEERLEGTAAAVALAVAAGARVVRVHDVGPLTRVVRVAEAISATRPRQ